MFRRSTKIVFEHPNLTALSQYILSRIQENLQISSNDEDFEGFTSLSSV